MQNDFKNTFCEKSVQAQNRLSFSYLEFLMKSFFFWRACLYVRARTGRRGRGANPARARGQFWLHFGDFLATCVLGELFNHNFVFEIGFCQQCSRGRCAPLAKPHSIYTTVLLLSSRWNLLSQRSRTPLLPPFFFVVLSGLAKRALSNNPTTPTVGSLVPASIFDFRQM